MTAPLRHTVRTLYAFARGYCGVSEIEVGSQLTLDHYQPREAGGTDEIDNLVYACHACNLYKSSAWNPQMPPVLHPLRTDLSLHLRTLLDGTLEGLTAEGKRHIDTLYLNRPPMIQRRIRLALIEKVLERDSQLDRYEAQIAQEVSNKKRLLRRRRLR